MLWHSISFFIHFNLAILLISLFQLLIAPTYYLYSPLYHRLITATKRAFGAVTVGISQDWAPTTFHLTQGRGPNHSTNWINFVKDHKGRATTLQLPKRAIWISNHQLLADWIYIWSFAYFAQLHGEILITLKAEIKWLPFVGWACQFFQFIFLSRSWVADKIPFLKQLQNVASKCGKEEGKGLALLIFPEGTLVTGNTRPISKKYADKIGVPDYKYLLHPRATGLFFALRTLALTVPDLVLLDLTIHYPDISPPPLWPEDRYNLLLWARNAPPAKISLYARGWSIAEIPLGVLDNGEGTNSERQIFEEWLRAIWGEKDTLMEHYEMFGNWEKEEEEVEEVPLVLRSWGERVGTYWYALPWVLIWWGIKRTVKEVRGLGRGKGEV